MYVVIEVEDGIFESIRLYTRSDHALEAGKQTWLERTGATTMHEDREITAEDMAKDEPGYDPASGGVSRGHWMHWWRDCLDVLIEEVDPDTDG